MIEYKSHSPEDTKKIAIEIAKKAAPGDVYALSGPMGAGKTAFSKAFCRALGVDETVSSPTFTVLNEYTDGTLPIYHFDCYRIEDSEALFEIGFDEYVYGQGICLIEWPEIIKDILPLEVILVKIDVLCNNERVITLSGGRYDS